MSVLSWIFLIPAFMDLPDPCVHLLDPCVQHGSAAYAAPFMGLPDACVHLLDLCVHGSS